MMLTPTWNPYTRLVRPLEAHNVATPEAYLSWQARIIAHNKAQLPARQWRDPFVSRTPVTPFVNGGRWAVLCPDCLNMVVYDPEWRLACCGECGAQYQDVPAPADAGLLEAVLLERPALRTRSWNTEWTVQAGPVESLIEIVRQNVEAGHAVPDAVIAAIAGDPVREPARGTV